MENENSSTSIVPKNYKDKDPRTLPFLYPNTINLVSYQKQAQVFYFHQMLELAEELARRQGYILLPYACIHWERAKKYKERKVKIGKKSYFMMGEKEMTKLEKVKLDEYVREVQNNE